MGKDYLTESHCERWDRVLVSFGEKARAEVRLHLTSFDWYSMSTYQMDQFLEILWTEKSMSGATGRMGLIGLAEFEGKGHSWALLGSCLPLIPSVQRENSPQPPEAGLLWPKI